MRRSVLVVCSIILFPAIVRGAISFFHPKGGELMIVAEKVFGSNVVNWLAEFVTFPVYDFLVHSFWFNSVLFWLAWLLCIFVVIKFTVPNSDVQGKANYKAFKRTKNSWLFHSVHIIANNFLPLNVALGIQGS